MGIQGEGISPPLGCLHSSGPSPDGPDSCCGSYAPADPAIRWSCCQCAPPPQSVPAVFCFLAEYGAQSCTGAVLSLKPSNTAQNRRAVLAFFDVFGPTPKSAPNRRGSSVLINLMLYALIIIFFAKNPQNGLCVHRFFRVNVLNIIISA